MTLAADLAYLVVDEHTSTPGIVHDPASPLVLGDVANSRYAVMSYNAITLTYTLQVVSPTGNCTYTFDADGEVLVDGLPIAEDPGLADIVAQCQAAATAAATSAGQAQTQAIAAANSATVATESADLASDAAVLAEGLAAAPAGASLPGGINSAAVSATIADTIAKESRDLDVGPDVTANENYAPGFCNTQRVVTAAGLVTVTIPPNIFSSPDPLERWGAYLLRSATGSVKVVPQAGSTGLQPPSRLINPRWFYRPASTTLPAPQVHQITVAVPAVVNGEIVVVYTASHSTTSTVPQGAVSSTGGLTWTVRKALPGVVTNFRSPDMSVWTAPLVAYAAQSVVITVNGGPNCFVQGLQVFVVEGTNGAVPKIGQVTGAADASMVEATMTAVQEQSLVLAFAVQNVSGNISTFSSWSSNLAAITAGNTNGYAETSAGDTIQNRNMIWACGSAVTSVTGNFTGRANFTAATARCGIALIAYGPKTVPGAGSVVLELEGGRDTLTVPYGVMELWFANDGKTCRVRTPKP